MQGVEPLLPQRPIGSKPLVQLGKWLGPEAVDTSRRVLANVDEFRLPEDSQMSRHTGSGDRQQCRQLIDGQRTFGQCIEHHEPAVIGESPHHCSFHRG